jgi:hypothetical protein
MNSRMMTRTLKSAIPIAPAVSAAFGRSACPPSTEPTPSCVSVIAESASQTTIILLSERAFTHHLMT